ACDFCEMTFATSCSANSQFCPEGCARAPRGQKKEHPSTGHTINVGDGERLHTASCQAPSPGLHRLLHAAWLKPAKARNQANLTAYLCPVWAVPAGWPGWKSAAPEPSLQPGGSVCGPRSCCWVEPVSRCRSRADESSPRGSCAPPSGSALQRQHDGG